MGRAPIIWICTENPRQCFIKQKRTVTFCKLKYHGTGRKQIIWISGNKVAVSSNSAWIVALILRIQRGFSFGKKERVFGLGRQIVTRKWPRQFCFFCRPRWDSWSRSIHFIHQSDLLTAGGYRIVDRFRMQAAVPFLLCAEWLAAPNTWFKHGGASTQSIQS